MCKCWALLLLLLLCYGYIKADSSCEQKLTMSYLDIAVDMIGKAKSSVPGCVTCESDLPGRDLDCSDLLQKGYKKSGVYTIWPVNRVNGDKSLEVYCDMETDGGGWTLIQRRGNFQNPNDYFFKDWKSYKEGFGDIRKEFWLGNDNIYVLSNQKLYSVRFDLRDVENNTRYAHYQDFWIDDENYGYTLHISDYSGDAGDSMIEIHKNQKFSTKDRDNDGSEGDNCAQRFKGGWWYGTGCHKANLNGLNFRGKHKSHADGVNWHVWKGYSESMESTEIKIRPKMFISPHVTLNTPE